MFYLVIDENFDSYNSSKTSFLLNGTSTITTKSLLNDPTFKYLERLVDASPVYRDFVRLGFIDAFDGSGIPNLVESLVQRNNSESVGATANATETSDAASHLFRLCTLNTGYALCKSYPALFVVPRDISDECVRKNAKCHRQARLPLIVWRHPTNKALLLRSSGFHGKGFIGMIMKGQTTSGSELFICN